MSQLHLQEGHNLQLWYPMRLWAYFLHVHHADILLDYDFSSATWQPCEGDIPTISSVMDLPFAAIPRARADASSLSTRVSRSQRWWPSSSRTSCLRGGWSVSASSSSTSAWTCHTLLRLRLPCGSACACGPPCRGHLLVAWDFCISGNDSICGTACCGSPLCSGNRGRPMVGWLSSVACHGWFWWVVGGLLRSSVSSSFEEYSCNVLLLGFRRTNTFLLHSGLSRDVKRLDRGSCLVVLLNRVCCPTHYPSSRTSCLRGGWSVMASWLGQGPQVL
jgi:hypothetical protein